MREIAIVGMGCRFPGADNLQDYWQLLVDARRQFHAVPTERWDHSRYFDAQDRKAVGKSYTDQVSYLDSIDDFDASYFRMPPRRVRTMDPQQRLLLTVTRDALQDAGWDSRPYDRTNTGVYFAMSTADFVSLTPDPADMDVYSIPGGLLNMAATSVSQFYDLSGPSFTVDSACCSGLLALHEAVIALRAGVCTEALVGGAYVNLIPNSLVGFSKVGAVSPTGVCRPFDQRADGFVLGEGVGVVVLRPLDAALAAGDRIYSVIRGVGCSNDGTTDGPMTPRAEGQYLALRRAYEDARVSADSVSFIEAHGTATTVGDRIELESLTRIRAEAALDGAAPRPAYLASVKALVGHSLTASGMAGLIKASLALRRGVIPRQPETVPGSELDPTLGGMRIPTENLTWHSDGLPRRAGINSFAFGGTNIHVVLEEAPPTAAAARSAPPRYAPEAETDAARRPELFLFSAGSVPLLIDYLDQFQRSLDDDPVMELSAVADTLAGRESLTARLAVVADSRTELTQRLGIAAAALREGRTGALGDGIDAGEVPRRRKQPKVAFLFPGQGSQRPGLLADLYERFGPFRRTADELDAAVRQVAGFSPLWAVYGPDANSVAGHERMRGTNVCQPLLGVVMLAAARLAQACGVTPTVTVGHSVGEFPAAAVAGALDDQEALRVMTGRGAVMAAAESDGAGGMLVVQADPERVDQLSQGLAGVWPACYNHPRQTVAAGTPEGLARLVARCAEAGVATRPIAVSNAFHTPLLDGVRQGVSDDLATRTIVRPAAATFVSCISGDAVDDPETLRGLWENHATSPVRFTEAATAAYEQGARIFVQVCGGQSLLSMTRRTLRGNDDAHYVALSADSPDDTRSFLRALGQLMVLGVPVTVPRAGWQPVVDLPPSRLATQRYPLPAFPDPQPAPPAPVAASLAAPEPSASSPEHMEGSSVNQIVSLLREQVALLRAADLLPGDSAAPVAAASPLAVAAVAPVQFGTRPAAIQAVPAAALAGPGTPTAPALAVGAGPANDQAALIRTAVIEQIARISAFPAEMLTGRELMVQELGFDSLMITELVTVLTRSWPQLAGDLPEVSKRPTVDEVVSSVVRRIDPTSAPAVVAAIAPPVAAPTAPVRAENNLAEYADINDHREAMREFGRNPYFLLHNGNVRSTTTVDGRELISYSSYNYLGLSGHPRVNEGVREAVETYGTSVSASRFLSGNRPLHTDLETELTSVLGTESSLVMVSGHATNVSLIGHIVGPGDLIVHDELAHDSILQGCRLSGATRRSFAHNDPKALDEVLARNRDRHRRALVVIEGVYSMDGDIATLPDIVEVKNRHGAILLVDEAHSLGVVGWQGGGIGEYFGIDRGQVELWCGTLSKAVASCGGYVAGEHDLIDYLRYTVPGFVYSVGITPPNAAAALVALQVMRDEPERLERLRENSKFFLRLAGEAGIDTGTSHDSPVIPCIVGDSARCLELANNLFDRGISVNPIMYPAVAEELSRLRFFITSEHSRAQIEHTIAILAEELGRLA